jgi:hypothetical protein
LVGAGAAKLHTRERVPTGYLTVAIKVQGFSTDSQILISVTSEFDGFGL